MKYISTGKSNRSLRKAHRRVSSPLVLHCVHAYRSAPRLVFGSELSCKYRFFFFCRCFRRFAGLPVPAPAVFFWRECSRNGERIPSTKTHEMPLLLPPLPPPPRPCPVPVWVPLFYSPSPAAAAPSSHPQGVCWVAAVSCGPQKKPAERGVCQKTDERQKNTCAVQHTPPIFFCHRTQHPLSWMIVAARGRAGGGKAAAAAMPPLPAPLRAESRVRNNNLRWVKKLRTVSLAFFFFFQPREKKKCSHAMLVPALLTHPADGWTPGLPFHLWLLFNRDLCGSGRVRGTRSLCEIWGERRVLMRVFTPRSWTFLKIFVSTILPPSPSWRFLDSSSSSSTPVCLHSL